MRRRTDKIYVCFCFIKGQKNGKPVKATLRLEYNGKWDDGFAAEYDGTYLVREVVELKVE